MREFDQRIADFLASRRSDEDHAETPSQGSSRAVQKTRAKKAPVASHGAFVPMLTIWGAALGALPILVVPPRLITNIAPQLGENAGIIAAAIAAVALGGVALAGASLFRRARVSQTRPHVFNAVRPRGIQPIDPTSELGSESLDAPIEDFPFVNSEEDEQGLPPEAEYELEAEAELGIEVVPELDPAAPRELDLADFAALPGRNAVWVEDLNEQEAEFDAEPAVAPTEEPARPQPAERLSAIEKLRGTPAQDLSLVQLVERFAAALHEHQDADQNDPASRLKPRRDEALAEALKALTVLSNGTLETEKALGDLHLDAKATALHDTTCELRDALAKLQSLTSAA